MPQLPPDKELIMHRFAESVADNKEKYITIDLFDPNAMKKYFDDKEKNGSCTYSMGLIPRHIN